MRNLTLERKIIISKTLAITKIIRLASVTVLTDQTITQLNKIHYELIRNQKIPKIKGGLKDVDIPSKITSPQWSWVKRLFDKNFHELIKVSNFREPLIFPNTNKFC